MSREIGQLRPVDDWTGPRLRVAQAESISGDAEPDAEERGEDCAIELSPDTERREVRGDTGLIGDTGKE